MPNSLRSVTRMDGVQAPIIPVVGDIIRQVPGTISLGQGVVHYGPPPAAVEAVQAAWDVPQRQRALAEEQTRVQLRTARRLPLQCLPW